MLLRSLFINIMLFSTLTSLASSPPPRCRPQTSWRTVDNWQMKAGEDAMMAGLVTVGHFAYATGMAGDGTDGYWVVRRSYNFGNTWSTIHRTQGAGRGIAVNKSNGHLYTIGFMQVGGVGREWVVRKSTNGGITWSIVDNFVADEPDDHYYIVTRVAVDGKGNVIVIGYDGHPGNEMAPLMRRSEDGGATWTTINFATEPFSGMAVVGTNEGGVFVGGTYRTSPGTGRWMIRYSPDGKTGWTVVDDFVPNPANEKSSGFTTHGKVMNDGTVVFVGGGSRGDDTGGLHLVRKSHLSSLSSWTTLDSYQPFSFSEGFGSAWANGVTFGRFGRIFTNAREQQAGSDFWASLARQGTTAPGSFVRSDRVMDPATINGQHEFVYSGGIDTLSNHQVLSGYVQEATGSKSWLVRKMSCAL